ncbi:hypothetical protein [Flavobacterium sp.]
MPPFSGVPFNGSPPFPPVCVNEVTLFQLVAAFVVLNNPSNLVPH